MASLNVVALISGGKDSFFSILHCLANGHKVVALANLHPQAQDAEDLDSFMYQTIGHAVIPLYEKALGLPLYRQEIQGTATVHERDYHHGDSEDETESLVPLLHKVLAAHPEVNAVSTGAILSDYQRTRVESVALRLGLTPLSYLWQWPSLPPQTPTSLLQDMAAVGQDSRIIKVASGGLDESFLWQNVAEARIISRLSKAAERFGTTGDGAVLGEGGEFETLAISGPAPLWKGRITITSEDIDIVPGEAGSASVKLRKASVALHSAEHSQALSAPAIRVPPLLNTEFDQMLQSLRSKQSFEPDDTIRAFSRPPVLPATGGVDQIETGAELLTNLTAEGATAAMQMGAIMDGALVTLARMGHSIHDVVNTIIVLRDMLDFTAVNPVYGSYFSRPNPPARITVACADVLPRDALLTVSMVVAPGEREGLHVQSRSYWAPANIGPYSQAIKQRPSGETAGGQVYIAGQIPLEPASMQLPASLGSPKEPTADFTLQSVLALQHLDRIGKVMKMKQWTYGIAFLASSGVDQTVIARRSDIARHAWKEYHSLSSGSTGAAEVNEDESEDFDVWDQQRGSRQRGWQSYVSAPENHTTLDEGLPSPIAQMSVVTSDSLPRGADIEWVGFGNSMGNQVSTLPAHLASLLRSFEHRIIP